MHLMKYSKMEPIGDAAKEAPDGSQRDKDGHVMVAHG